MITNFKKYKINESITNFDLNKLVKIVSITKNNNEDWIYKTNKGNIFILKKNDTNIISIINDNISNFVNSGNPIIKYFETDSDNNVITYAANFTVDIVALNNGRVYLIERKDGKGWALPGGFIETDETPQDAAVREFQEETLAKISDIKNIKPMNMTKCNDAREINFFTFPFIMDIKNNSDLKFGDDAIKGKWYLAGRASRSKLAFSHHNEILKQIYF